MSHSHIMGSSATTQAGVYETMQESEKILKFNTSASSSRKIHRERFNFKILNEAGGNTVSISVVDSAGVLAEKPLRITKFEFPIEVFGDTFYFTRDSEGVFVFHKSWSLIGEGSDLKQAIEDLHNTIRELKNQLVHARIDELDKSAVEFREYLLSQLNA